MPGMMSDADWQSYRDTARQQTANMNAMPYVFDPSQASSDRAVNQQTLYGLPQGAQANQNLSSIVTRAFRDFFGHAPSEADMTAWVSGAATHGLNAQQLYDGIGAAARTMGGGAQGGTGNAPNATAGGTMMPAANGFSQGMMGQDFVQPSSDFNFGTMRYK